nr:MAG TPA: hypothetical protein [Caudoviricetes sp.]
MAELRHDGSDEKRQSDIIEKPALRVFCFPAIRQGYSRGALHQYPCHIVEKQNISSLAICGAFRIQASLAAAHYPTVRRLRRGRPLWSLAHSLYWSGCDCSGGRSHPASVPTQTSNRRAFTEVSHRESDSLRTLPGHWLTP